MSRAKNCIAVLIIFFILPFSHEVTENLFHYFAFGHFSILESEGPHHKHNSGEEGHMHGCCENGCQKTAQFVMPVSFIEKRRTVPAVRTRTSIREAGNLLSGFSVPPFRPPCV